MFGFSLLVTGAVSIISVLIVGLFAFWGVSRISSASGADSEAIVAGSIATILLGSLIPIVLSIAAVAVLQGVIVLEVARGTLGEKHTLAGLLRAARGRIWALIGWALLATLVVSLAVTIVVVAIVLLVTFGGPAGIGVSVGLGLLAGLGFAVLGAWLWTRLCLVPTAIVIERLPIRQAVSRSWSLTIGYFWKTLGIQLLVAVIISVVSQVVSIPLSIVMSFVSVLINPQGDVDASIGVIVVIYALTLLLSVVISAISAVIQSATTALIYIDIRMRKEGLDLELARFVEARQAGDDSVPDPYLVRPSAPAPAPPAYT
ncbi:hypothetical protein LH407_10935 [Antiquaquibacter oligotrophicus]|nr:hypothetical protein [Antiquaquibacter oligotrophicus]UDF12665.1 hypothetical protein LH407_10935 [Antiquaquibacter oligotrophicus]